MLWSYENNGNSMTSPKWGINYEVLEEDEKHARKGKKSMTTENYEILLLKAMLMIDINNFSSNKKCNESWT